MTRVNARFGRYSAFVADGLVAAGTAAVVAITRHVTRHACNGPVVRDALTRMLTLAVFATMAAAILTGLVTSCGGLDSAGYVGAADLLLHGHLTEYVPVATLLPFVPATPAAAPLGWVAASQPFHIAPEFPLGLPMVMALARQLFGRTAPFLVAPTLAAAA